MSGSTRVTRIEWERESSEGKEPDIHCLLSKYCICVVLHFFPLIELNLVYTYLTAFDLILLYNERIFLTYANPCEFSNTLYNVIMEIFVGFWLFMTFISAYEVLVNSRDPTKDCLRSYMAFFVCSVVGGLAPLTIVLSPFDSFTHTDESLLSEYDLTWLESEKRNYEMDQNCAFAYRFKMERTLGFFNYVSFFYFLYLAYIRYNIRRETIIEKHTTRQLLGEHHLT